jgi:hypothetical protein
LGSFSTGRADWTDFSLKGLRLMIRSSTAVLKIADVMSVMIFMEPGANDPSMSLIHARIGAGWVAREIIVSDPIFCAYTHRDSRLSTPSRVPGSIVRDAVRGVGVLSSPMRCLTDPSQDMDDR